MKVIDGLVMLGAAGGAALTHSAGGWELFGGIVGGAIVLPAAVSFTVECTSRR